VEERGGKVTTSVSAKTTAVVAGEAPGAAKVEKANALGIRMIEEETFVRLLAVGQRALE
jgi:DNA ligase (NAD+)